MSTLTLSIVLLYEYDAHHTHIFTHQTILLFPYMTFHTNKQNTRIPKIMLLAFKLSL